ncbi:hypothetical protein VKT23_017256 [Stygiomarasmius scandens]|uniref:Uncharacterized protein n=1 Tax=Marasmiellus scandens TaxID=2682957 RepID=A0ABR1IUW2_9AGAR
MNATATLKSFTAAKQPVLANFPLDFEPHWLQSKSDSNCTMFTISSNSELSYLFEPASPLNIPSIAVTDYDSDVTEVDGELEFDSYYFGKYDEEDQDEDENDISLTFSECLALHEDVASKIPIQKTEEPKKLNLKAFQPTKPQLEKENEDPIPNAFPNDYFWAVYPQNLYVCSARMKKQVIEAQAQEYDPFAAASPLANVQIESYYSEEPTENKAASNNDEWSNLKKVFNCRTNVYFA